MKITKIETKETEVIIDAICNKCGSSCKGSIGNLNGLIEAEIYGAYDSSHLGDGNIYQFSLCEKCCFELFATFKHTALKSNYLFPEEGAHTIFIIDSFNKLTNEDYNDWTTKLYLYMRDDMELNPVPAEKIWRVKGSYGSLLDLAKNKDLQMAGFIIAQEISEESKHK